MERGEELIAELRSEFLLREEELGLLHDIDLQLLETERPLNTTFDLIIHRTQELINSDHMHILIRRGRFLEGMYSTSNSDLGQQVDIANSLTGQCFSHETALNVADVTAQPWRESYVPIAGYDGPPMRSLLATAIKVHDTIVGVLNSESIRPNAFTPVHEKILKAISSQVAMALQRAQLFDRNALFAEVDQLIFSDSEDPDVVQLALEKVLTALHDLEHVQLTTAQ